jgi:cytoskeletal protein RodZ
MSDFSFMRSGQMGDVAETSDGTDFMRKVVSILAVLSEEALSTAQRFAKACGRTVVTPEDMLYALRYESRAFWEKDIAARFFARLEEEREHTYDTEEDEDEEESDEDGEESDEDEHDEGESYGVEAVCDQEFHQEVMRIASEWDAWQPDDPVKALLKQAIDNTAKKFNDDTTG